MSKLNVNNRVYDARRAGVIAGLLISVLGCGTAATPGSGPVKKVSLRGAGSSFVGPLYRKWFEQYESEAPGVEIRYDVVGSFQGTKEFLSGDADFGASDAALTDKQIEELHGNVWLVPDAAGAIVLAYNPQDLPAGLKLSRAAYVGIFLGKIKRWDDPQLAALNPGVALPKRDIAIVVRADGSGTTFAFTNHMAAVSREWKDGPGVGLHVDWPVRASFSSGNEGVAGSIKQTPGAIGYVEYGIARAAKLPMAKLENKAGNYIEPSPNSGLDSVLQAKMPSDFRVFMPDPEGAASYPIVTFSWMFVHRRYDDADKQEAVRKLVGWCLNDGQRFSESLGYIRLPPHVAQEVQAAMNQQVASKEKSP